MEKVSHQLSCNYNKQNIHTEFGAVFKNHPMAGNESTLQL